MTKKDQAPKASNEINVDLASELKKCVGDVNAERVWWGNAKAEVLGGRLSVRGLKATIEKVENDLGSAPTVKSTTAQYFEDSFKVEALEGGAEAPLKDILNGTIQAVRKLGGRGKNGANFDDFLKGVKSFSGFMKKVEALPKKENASAPKTADSIMEAYVKAVSELENIAPSDPDIWTKFLAIVDAQRKAIIKKHPSAKVA
jgi:hypothetical protein